MGISALGYHFFHYIADSQPKAILSPRGQLTMFGDVFGLQLGGATGIYCIEARDAAIHPTKQRAAPTTKDDLAPSSVMPDAEAQRPGSVLWLPLSRLRLKTKRPMWGRGRAGAEGPRPGPGSRWCERGSPTSTSQAGRGQEMRH